jgi:hypothetical protein
MNKFESGADFDQLVDNEIIDAHFPLHSIDSFNDNNISWAKYARLLMINLIPTNWYQEHVKEIQGIKKYNGERFAFHYWFFISYQAMLIIPGIVGLIFAGL